VPQQSVAEEAEESMQAAGSNDLTETLPQPVE